MFAAIREDTTTYAPRCGLLVMFGRRLGLYSVSYRALRNYNLPQISRWSQDVRVIAGRKP